MINCSWRSDESPGCQQLNITNQPQEDGFTKIEISTKGGSPVNLIAKPTDESISFPDSYWYQVRIIEKEGSISVGVVTPDEFQPGYKLKGMFYNGNLTNGSAALKTAYGPYLKQGDFIALECTHLRTTNSGSTFSMTIYLNGKKVGCGFEIATAHPEQKFFPCLAVHGKAELLTQVVEQKPTMESIPMHPLDGKWKVVNAKEDTTGHDYIIPVKDEAGNELPDQKDIILTIEPSGESSLHLSIKICNNISIGMQYTVSPDQRIFDVTLVTEGMMTRMMPPPPYHKVENEIVKIVRSHWQSFRLKVEEGGSVDTAKEMSITTINNHVMAHCVRLDNEQVPPLNKYHH